MKLLRFLTQEEQEWLNALIKSNKLTKDTKGYEELPNDTYKVYADEVAKINAILTEVLAGYERFQNFKPRRTGGQVVRFQYNYHYDSQDHPFTGVGYISLKELSEGFKEKEERK